MPITYTRDDDRRRIIGVSSGVVTLADVLEFVDRQLAEGGWTYGVLYDTRGVQSRPTVEEMERMLDHIQQICRRQPRGPVAIVAGDDAMFGLARVYSIGGQLADIAADVAVFRDITSAEQWLDATRC